MLKMKQPSIETIMTTIAAFWLIWELFFEMGLDLLILIGFDHSLLWIMRIFFIALFLLCFLWMRTRSKTERSKAYGRVW